MKKKIMKKIIAALCTVGALAIPFSASAMFGEHQQGNGVANPQPQNLVQQVNIVNNHQHHQIPDNYGELYLKEMRRYKLAEPWSDDIFNCPGLLMLEKDTMPICPFAEHILREKYKLGFSHVIQHQNPVILPGNATPEMQQAYNKGYAVTLANHDAIYNLNHQNFNDANLQEIYDITYRKCTAIIGDLDRMRGNARRICTWAEVQNAYDMAYNVGDMDIDM